MLLSPVLCTMAKNVPRITNIKGSAVVNMFAIDDAFLPAAASANKISMPVINTVIHPSCVSGYHPL